MSCNLTIISDDSSNSSSSNKVVVTNDTIRRMDNLFIVPSSSYSSSTSNYTYRLTYSDALSNSYLYIDNSVTIDLDNYAGSTFYLVFIDNKGDRWDIYVDSSSSSISIFDDSLFYDK